MKYNEQRLTFIFALLFCTTTFGSGPWKQRITNAYAKHQKEIPGVVAGHIMGGSAVGLLGVIAINRAIGTCPRYDYDCRDAHRAGTKIFGSMGFIAGGYAGMSVCNVNPNVRAGVTAALAGSLMFKYAIYNPIRDQIRKDTY